MLLRNAAIGFAELLLGAIALAVWAIPIVVVMELHKAWRRRRPIGRLARPGAR